MLHGGEPSGATQETRIPGAAPPSPRQVGGDPVLFLDGPDEPSYRLLADVSTKGAGPHTSCDDPCGAELLPDALPGIPALRLLEGGGSCAQVVRFPPLLSVVPALPAHEVAELRAVSACKDAITSWNAHLQRCMDCQAWQTADERDPCPMGGPLYAHEVRSLLDLDRAMDRASRARRRRAIRPLGRGLAG